jgi:K+-transporting ATPase ATPase A chain
MLAMTVQNFVSAATGMAVLVAFVRGFARRSVHTVGNFWVDTVRGILYILLPLALLLAILLVSQGVAQTFAPSQTVAMLQPTADAQEGRPKQNSGAGVGHFPRLILIGISGRGSWGSGGHTWVRPPSGLLQNYPLVVGLQEGGYTPNAAGFLCKRI